MKTVGVIGAGATGTVIAKQLLDAFGDDFCIIASKQRADRLKKGGLKLNDECFLPTIVDPHKTNRKIDLIIICVKNYHLEQTIEDLRPLVSENTCILPLLNGVTAVDTLREHFPQAHVLYGIIMRTDAERLGRAVRCSVKGKIQVGYEKDSAINRYVDEVYSFLSSSGIDIQLYPDIKRMQWKKWLINIGSNQVSVVTHAEFLYFGKVKEIVELMRLLMNEIVALAKIEGVALYESDVEEAIDVLIHYPPMKKTSMLQDIIAERRTEIDYFAGTVIQKSKKYGIESPANLTLYLSIKAMEKVYLMRREEPV